MQNYYQRDARKVMGIQRRAGSYPDEKMTVEFFTCLRSDHAVLSFFPAGLMLVSSLVYFKLCTCRIVIWMRLREYEHTQLYLLSPYITCCR